MLIELRIYQITAGRMDDWLKTFREELQPLIETKGAHVAGSFVNPDVQNEFIWLRSYASVEVQEAFKKDFYESPEWLAMKDRVRGMVVKSESRLIKPTAFSALH